MQRFDQLQVGDPIPALEKAAFIQDQLSCYAHAGADDNPIHVDAEQARAAGLPGVIAHGMLTMGFLGQALTDWVGQRAIRSLSVRFAAIAMLGDTVNCTGVISDKREEAGERRVEVELAAVNQKGERLQTGRAIVALD